MCNRWRYLRLLMISGWLLSSDAVRVSSNQNMCLPCKRNSWSSSVCGMLAVDGEPCILITESLTYSSVFFCFLHLTETTGWWWWRGRDRADRGGEGGRGERTRETGEAAILHRLWLWEYKGLWLCLERKRVVNIILIHELDINLCQLV